MTGQAFKWMVYRQGGCLPKKFHYDRQEAEIEAARISAKENAEVFVLAVCGSFKPSTPPIEWVPATYEDKDI